MSKRTLQHIYNQHSQTELAKHWGVSQGMVSKLRVGEVKPSAATIARIHKHTGLSLNRLFIEFGLLTKV